MFSSSTNYRVNGNSKLTHFLDFFSFTIVILIRIGIYVVDFFIKNYN